MPLNVLDFEKPIAELEANIAELRRLSAEEGIDRSAEIQDLEQHRNQLISRIFSNLTAWDKTLLARHPNRPYTMDYVRLVFDDYLELHGDRLFGDDKAIVGGIAFLDGSPVVFIGHQKGRDLKDRQYRNFGSAKPEGYRKAIRLMKLAERFRRPVVVFVDTPAADCSVESEERGISESIAHSMSEMALLQAPIVVVIIGEGGSGGAIGIGVGNRVLMQQYAIYSVIPPEGCAAILWRDATRGPEAAECLGITAEDALRYKIVDEVIPEPLGAAHRNYESAAALVKKSIVRCLSELAELSPEEIVAQRYNRFRAIGVFSTVACPKFSEVEGVAK